MSFVGLDLQVLAGVALTLHFLRVVAETRNSFFF
jgi:hypothetical protein